MSALDALFGLYVFAMLLNTIVVIVYFLAVLSNGLYAKQRLPKIEKRLAVHGFFLVVGLITIPEIVNWKYVAAFALVPTGVVGLFLLWLR